MASLACRQWDQNSTYVRAHLTIHKKPCFDKVLHQWVQYSEYKALTLQSCWHVIFCQLFLRKPRERKESAQAGGDGPGWICDQGVGYLVTCFVCCPQDRINKESKHITAIEAFHLYSQIPSQLQWFMVSELSIPIPFNIFHPIWLHRSTKLFS